jgi:hypothetical protein
MSHMPLGCSAETSRPAANKKAPQGAFLFVHRSDRVEIYVKVIEKFIENGRKILRKHREMIASMAFHC